MAIRKEEPEEIIKTPEDLYEDAVKRMEQGDIILQYAYKEENYRLTAEAFDELNGLHDSKELAAKCRELADKAHKDGIEHTYADAAARMEKEWEELGEWEKLAVTFTDLGSYKDSASRAKTCMEKADQLGRRRKRKGRIRLLLIVLLVACVAYLFASGGFRYLLGWGYLKTGQYEDAINSFKKAGSFANAEDMALKSTLLALENAEQGSVVAYGDFKWKVLENNGDEKTILLIVSSLGESNPMKSVRFEENGGETSWESCSLRTWLNGEILEDYFGDKERACILKRDSAASANKTYGTSYDAVSGDYLSPLSAEEVEEYEEVVSKMGSDWWLRTPGADLSTVSYMTGHHSVMSYGTPSDTDDIAVRPVILVDLEAFSEVI